jgi:glycosyltransferase involved in cell wall biosynthesis
MDARKTVLLLTPGAQAAPGGIARIVDYTVRGWPSDSPFRLRVVDTYGPGSIIMMPLHFFLAITTLLYALLFDNVHLLHVNMSERLSVTRKLLMARIGVAFGVPVVIHMHGASFADYFERLPNWRRNAIRRTMRSCSTVIVLGSYWRDFAVARLRIPHHKVRILYNAVPLTQLAEKNPALKCRLVFLGVVGQRKGVDTLLSALSHPLLADGEWDAVIGGNGEVARFKAFAAKLGIAHRVKFTGLLDEEGVKDQLSQADIFVLPSRNEGLPVAILEAMSYGCAIVTTPVGSIKDAIIQEKTGLLVDADDHVALAGALSRLVENSTLRRTLGAAARAKFQASFGLPYYVSELESVYQNATVRTDPSAGVRYQT